MTAKQNLLSVLDYLLHLERMRTRPIFRLSDHKLPFFHEHVFEGLPGVETDLIQGAEEIWLNIRRLQANPPPEPHDWLKPWINVPNDPSRTPTISDSLVIAPDCLPPTGRPHRTNGEPTPRTPYGVNPAVDPAPGRGETAGSSDTAPDEIAVRLEDVPEIQELYARYVTESWTAWSAVESARRKTIQKYDQFFSLMQDVETGGGADDGIEIAWGIGVALWDKDNGATSIAYPLISQTVEFQIDPQTMAITVRPTKRESLVHIDAFAALEIPQAADVEARARNELKQSAKTLSPFDRATYDGILRFAASQLDSHGVYWPDERAQEADRSLPSAPSHLLVTDTWVIYARRRSTDFIAADVQRLKQAVTDAEVLPAAPALVVTVPSDVPVNRERRQYRGISSPALGAVAGNDGGSVDDLFFPKPFNEEQVSIINRLDQADGVVVQGPPGTGKTHTIANVICHYLATGKKVLVTAQHEAPLAVLQDQIPEALRPLTISLLTSERDGLKQLEQSVRKIAGEVNTLSESELDREIRAESAKIEQLHQQLAGIDRDLQAWASKQTAEVPFLGDNTRPAKLARYVVEQEAQYAWFPDLLDGTDHTLPRFTEEDIETLRSARRQLGAALVYLSKTVPQRAGLPLPEDMVRLHADLQQLGALNHQVFETAGVPLLREYTLAHFRKLEGLQILAGKAHAVLQAVSQLEWQRAARRLLSRSGDTPVGHHFREWVKAVLDLEKTRQQFLGDALTVPVQAEGLSGVFEAVSRLAQGKRAFGFFGGDGAVKEVVRSIRIGGAEPGADAQWARVRDYLETAREATKRATQWGQLRGEFNGPKLDVMGFAAIKPMADMARPLASIWAFDARIAVKLVDAAKELFANGIEFDQLTDSLAELDRLRGAIDDHLRHSRLKAAARSRQMIEDALRNCEGPVVEKMKGFLRSLLGNELASPEIIMNEWSDLLEKLRRVEEQQGALAAVAGITAQIARSGATQWAALLREEYSEATEERLLPPRWREAWEWARAKGYLEKIDGRKALRRLADDRALAEESLQRAYLKVVELRTWRELKRNMTPRVGAALNAYLSAIARMGRGTGVRAVRYRQDARKAMANAYAATPCWIMAHWRVSESLPPELGMFDLLIIDEASQSDVWALPAIARAKKLLVVGDDKQVSPSDVGLRETDIRTVRDRFLRALPYGEHLLPGTSIYDLASTMFASDVIRLREHFRCVTPIIEFSNRQFYDHEIKPLRVPKPSERLDPPLIDVYVKGGYRAARKKINKPEAAAIVEEIKRITASPAMAHRTIGVVSLLGSDQAKHIQERLVNELGEDVVLRHDIRCGDAMHFQGKEADVVMISMVAAGDIRADSGRTYEQRYNVACSRARDRMYVFRSFDRGSVSDSDLRARLLDHLENPLGLEEPEIQELRELCESGFEREVYDVLVERGFQVKPQVRAGGYRIDLVVEGGDDQRLAIECDGDQYHGVDRWMEDLARQRVLERMGWRFWRCWASSWIADRETCIDDLLEALSARGIQPAATGARTGDRRSSVVEHRIVEPQNVESADGLDEAEPAGGAVMGDSAAAWTPQPSVMRSATAADEGRVSYEGGSATGNLTGPGRPSISPRVTEVRRGANPRLAVDLGDLVTYVNVDEPGTLLSVCIVHGNSAPSAGMISEQTPLAEALLEAEEGDIVEAHLPMGTARFRIVSVARRSTRQAMA
jgi:very-short-patch-repair endonuclease